MATSKEKRIAPRPPVIVVMGHIDHGKSTLLDYIRKANTVAGEAGGITQHVGAYEAVYKDKNGTEHPLTFIDTPGHEAFGAIRTRGAQAADIAVLVVSGEDGVKPQTVEALSAIKKSGIPYVVAINKIDRPGVDIEQTKANLAEHEIYVEGYGGDVPWVALSALNGTGVPELLEVLVLLAEMAGLTTDTTAAAEGIIIEAHMDRKKGIAATLIIKNGTLSVGDIVVAGSASSPVRAIEDRLGKTRKTATGGTPAQIVGWNKLPNVGSRFVAASSRKEAEVLAAKAESSQVTAAPAVESEGITIIPLVVKADTSGSLDAVRHEIKKINVEGVRLKLLSAGVGTITENDLKLAAGGTAPLVVGFNVLSDASAKAFAERAGFPIMTFDIIYRLSEWLSEEVGKRRPRVEVEEETGSAKVLKLFTSDKGRFVIGGRVETGTIKNGGIFKILRRSEEIGRGKIKSLQQLKSKIEEAKKDTEFGAQIESKIEPAPGDRLQVFITTLK